jgi:hypothetical protein
MYIIIIIIIIIIIANKETKNSPDAGQGRTVFAGSIIQLRHATADAEEGKPFPAHYYVTEERKLSHSMRITPAPSV